MEILDEHLWLERLRRRENPARDGYRAMYSTWWNGIVTDPALMVIPVDDHQVHRGDAVFEAIKAVNGRIWLAREHLDRMDRSGAAIGLVNPLSRAEMETVLIETMRASGLKDAVLRLFLSRGPGQFSTNPYDSVGPQVQVIATVLKPWPAAKIEAGVSLGLSRVPVKEPWLARIKSCNYLANVLMKKEAVDRGLDFTVGVDGDGCLTEGSTENLMLVDADGWLVRPKPDGILAGTTMQRAFELAKAAGTAKGFAEKDLTLEDLRMAREVMMVGTTLDVLPVSRLEQENIGGGGLGSIARELRELLARDQAGVEKTLSF